MIRIYRFSATIDDLSNSDRFKDYWKIGKDMKKSKNYEGALRNYLQAYKYCFDNEVPVEEYIQFLTELATLCAKHNHNKKEGLESAQKYLNQALVKANEILNCPAKLKIFIYFKLCAVYIHMKDIFNVQSHFENGLNLEIKCYGNTHPTIAMRYHRMALGCESVDKDVALDYARRSLEVYQKLGELREGDYQNEITELHTLIDNVCHNDERLLEIREVAIQESKVEQFDNVVSLEESVISREEIPLLELNPVDSSTNTQTTSEQISLAPQQGTPLRALSITNTTSSETSQPAGLFPCCLIL